MRVIARSAVIVGILAAALRGDTHADVVDLFASMAAGLSDNNAAQFMKAFDRNMPDHDRLKTQIEALVQNSEVGSSVEILKDEGDERKRDVDVDWYLELRSRVTSGPFKQSRGVIHCQLEKEGKHWRIVALKPIGFFDAPAY